MDTSERQDEERKLEERTLFTIENVNIGLITLCTRQILFLKGWNLIARKMRVRLMRKSNETKEKVIYITQKYDNIRQHETNETAGKKNLDSVILHSSRALRAPPRRCERADVPSVA